MRKNLWLKNYNVNKVSIHFKPKINIIDKINSRGHIMSEKILSISVAAYNVEKYLVKLFEILNISPEVNRK